MHSCLSMRNLRDKASVTGQSHIGFCHAHFKFYLKWVRRRGELHHRLFINQHFYHTVRRVTRDQLSRRLFVFPHSTNFLEIRYADTVSKRLFTPPFGWFGDISLNKVEDQSQCDPGDPSRKHVFVENVKKRRLGLLIVKIFSLHYRFRC